jgi:hypothetical protein
MVYCISANGLNRYHRPLIKDDVIISNSSGVANDVVMKFWNENRDQILKETKDVDNLPSRYNQYDSFSTINVKCQIDYDHTVIAWTKAKLKKAIDNRAPEEYNVVIERTVTETKTIKVTARNSEEAHSKTYDMIDGGEVASYREVDVTHEITKVSKG